MGVYLDTATDLPLFAPRLAPAVQRSRTSLEAADALTPETLNAMQRRVYVYLRDQGERGATDEECQRGLQMNPSSQRPRRVELADAGLIVRAGTRKTASNRNADVWRVA